jgi:hypothetical protein
MSLFKTGKKAVLLLILMSFVLFISVLMTGCSSNGNVIAVSNLSESEEKIVKGVGLGANKAIELDKDVLQKNNIKQFTIKYKIIGLNKIINEQNIISKKTKDMKNKERYFTSIVYDKCSAIFNVNLIMGDKVVHKFKENKVCFKSDMNYRNIIDSVKEVKLNQDYILNLFAKENVNTLEYDLVNGTNRNYMYISIKFE